MTYFIKLAFIRRAAFGLSVISTGIYSTSLYANPLFSKKRDSQNTPHEKKEDSPLRIVADEMDCDQKTNICTATGNAFAQKMNDPKKQSISADKLVAHFEKSEDKKAAKKKKKSNAGDDQSLNKSDGEALGNTSLKKIEAFGHVIMTDDQTIIRCNEGVYHIDTELADLTGDVAITQDKNVLTGTHGHANLKDGTYNIKNEKGRVEGLFYQKDKEEKDKK